MIQKVSIPAGGGFQVLNLRYYKWRWVFPLEVLEIDFGRVKGLYEVRKFEKNEDEIIAVVSPIIQNTVCEGDEK